MKCTRLGCDRPATHTIRPAYGRPWFGCLEHQAAMAGALAIGQPQAFTVDVKRLAGGQT